MESNPLITPSNLFGKIAGDHAQSVTLERHEHLKVSGSTDTNIYFVREGSMRIYVLDDCEERIIRFAYTDDIVVSLDSFLTEKPSEFYIQALKKTKVDVISKKHFLEYINNSEANLRLWANMLEGLVVQQIEREKDLLTNSPKERYLRVLERSPQLFQQIPAKHIANYLRMTPETFSRLKKS